MPHSTDPRPHKRPNRSLVLSAAALVVILGAIAVLAVLRYQRYQEIRAQTEQLAEHLVARADSAFMAVPALTNDDAAALRTYRNPEHLEAAERYGVDPPVDREAAEKLVAADQLISLEDNRYFRLQDMDHSVPYVTESAQHLLNLIGVRFQEALAEAGLPPYRYVITSGTRTLADQTRLRGVNVNAAAKSSHWFGTTVDLHYAQFDYPAAYDSLDGGDGIDPTLLKQLVEDDYEAFAEQYDAALKGLLGRVLRDLQQEGRLLAIYERRQPVYHITVADAVPDPLDGELAATERETPRDVRAAP